MSYEAYLKADFPTPECFAGQYEGSSALIIATGPSTKKLLPYKEQLKSRFDVIIGVNFAMLDFDDQMDFHMVMENRPTKIAEYMRQNQYNKYTPKILNYMSIRWMPKNYNIYKTIRWYFDGKPNIREYNLCEGGFGLFKGYNKKPFSRFSSVALQAIHFAGILGCNNIYMIGADMVFRNSERHYSGYTGKNHKEEITDAQVRDKEIVEIRLGGRAYVTYALYKETADWINKFIEEECRPKGIKFYDFSDGLITSAKQINLDRFIEYDIRK